MLSWLGDAARKAHSPSPAIHEREDGKGHAVVVLLMAGGVFGDVSTCVADLPSE